MYFAVTGCAGFIGAHLVERLLSSGHAVVGVDRLSDYYPVPRKWENMRSFIDNPRFTWIEGDLATLDMLAPFEGVDGVFHLAAQPGVRTSWGREFETYVSDNILATQRLFEAVADRARVVYASSSSVYGNAIDYPTSESVALQPVSPYGITKGTCEHLAYAYSEAVGLDAVGLRFFTVYGPRQRPDMAFTAIATALKHGREFTLNGSGTQSRDFTYVADAVEAMLLSMARAPSGQVFNVGGGEEATLLDCIGIFEGVAGCKLRVVRKEEARGDIRRTAADTSSIASAVGWEARTPLADGIKKHYQWAESSPEV